MVLEIRTVVRPLATKPDLTIGRPAHGDESPIADWLEDQARGTREGSAGLLHGVRGRRRKERRQSGFDLCKRDGGS